MQRTSFALGLLATAAVGNAMLRRERRPIGPNPAAQPVATIPELPDSSPPAAAAPRRRRFERPRHELQHEPA